jgi:tetratricopeptide (TPR) repeat protein
MKCPDCDNELEKMKRTYFCKECERNFPFSFFQKSALEERVIAHYPYIIAHPFNRLLQESNPLLRLGLVITTFTNILKYLSLIVETEYLRMEGYASEEINRFITDGLTHPLISTWDDFLKTSMTYMMEAGHQFFMPEIITFYKQSSQKALPEEMVSLPKVYYDEDGQEVHSHAQHGLIQAMISFRNKNAHERAELKDFSAAENILQRLLDKLAWVSEYKLLKRENGITYSMMGAKIQCIDIQIPDAMPSEGLVLSKPDGNTFLSLLPFFVVPSAYISDCSPELEVLIYDMILGKRILYISPEGPTTIESEATLGIWRDLVECKVRALFPLLGQKGITPENLAERCSRITTYNKEALERCRKILPGIYYHRSEAEEELDLWLHSSFPIMLMHSQPGGGKTYLAHQMCQKWTDQGDSILFLRGNNLGGTDFKSILCRNLRIDHNLCVEEIVRGATDGRKRWVVAVDGINECPGKKVLLNSIENFCRQISDVKEFKVLLTARNDDLDWFKNDLDTILFYRPQPVKALSNLPGLNILPLTLKEADDLWNVYRKKGGPNFRLSFKYKDILTKSRDTASFLNSPLLIRIFMELFSVKGPPHVFSRSEIFAQYFESISSYTKDDGAFLLEFSRICLKLNKTVLEKDDLVNDAVTRDIVLQNQVDSVYMKLRRKGIISELHGLERISVCFVVDSFFEYVLGRYLIEMGLASTPQSLTDLCDLQENFYSLKGACRVALEIQVKKYGVQFLFDFLDAAGNKAIDIVGSVLGRLIIDKGNAYDLATGLMNFPATIQINTSIRVAAFMKNELAYKLYIDFLLAIFSGLKHCDEKNLTTFLFYQMLLSELIETANYAHTEEIIDTIEKDLAIVLNSHALSSKQSIEDSKALAGCLHNIGMAYYFRDDLINALASIKKAVALYSTVSTIEDGNTSWFLNSYGVILCQLGKHEAALEVHHHALYIEESYFGRFHPRVAWTCNNIGIDHYNRKEFEEAILFHKRAADIDEHFLGESHPDLGWDFNSIGLCHARNNSYQQAIEWYQKALGIWSKYFSEDYPDIISCHKNLGEAFCHLGDSVNCEFHRNTALASKNKMHFKNAAIERVILIKYLSIV